MPISKPQASSSDIELPVLTSHAPSIQPPLERVPFSSPISEANSIAMVDQVEPPTTAYFPPSNDNPPLQSSDIGLLEYTQLHGQSETPLSSRQRDDRTSDHASLASVGEELPAYRADNLPRYSQRLAGGDSEEPLTWPAISFRIGFCKSFPQQRFGEYLPSLRVFRSMSNFLVHWGSYIIHTSRFIRWNIYAMVQRFRTYCEFLARYLGDGGRERRIFSTHACHGKEMGKMVFICVLCVAAYRSCYCRYSYRSLQDAMTEVQSEVY
jgi:hypothetical protein